MSIRLRKSLDLPIPGPPVQAIDSAPPVHSAALLGDDFPDVRLALRVDVDDRVRAGQILLTDRRRPEIGFASPAAGRVAAIHRGDARRVLAVEIAIEGEDCVESPHVTPGELRGWSAQRTTEALLRSGDWIALRERPFGRIARPGKPPAAIFVRAMDSDPLAVDAAVVARDRGEDLQAGLLALSRLTDGPLYLCCRPGALAPVPEVERLEQIEIEGPHPSGLVGTHVHLRGPIQLVQVGS